MRRKLLFAGPVVAIALGLGVYFFTVKSHDKQASSPFVPVKVTQGRLTMSVDATGNVEPAKTVDITSDAAGKITALNVEPGDSVHEGQVLARIDDTDARARVTSAQDDLNAAEDKLQAAKTDAVIGPVQAVLQLASAGYSLSEARNGLDVSGANKSADTAGGGIGQNPRSAMVQAGLDLAGAVANAADTVTNDDLSTARTSKKEADDALASAAENLASTVVVAPCNGVVADVGGTVGAMASSNAALFTIADTGRLLVKASVNEDDISQLKPDQPVTVTLDALQGKEFKGKVVSVGDLGSAQDNIVMFPVTISLDDPGHQVKAGMTADVNIITAQHDNVVTVPNAAVQDRMGQEAVRVYSAGGRVSYRQVTTGLRTETQTEIVSGLKAGDTIAVPVASAGSASRNQRAGLQIPGMGSFGGQAVRSYGAGGQGGTR